MRNQIGISPTNWTEVTLAREFLVITVSYELQLAYEYLLWTPTCCKHDLKVRVLIQAFASDLLLKDRVTHFCFDKSTCSAALLQPPQMEARHQGLALPALMCPRQSGPVLNR
jgi:hypothetical protein